MQGVESVLENDLNAAAEHAMIFRMAAGHPGNGRISLRSK